MPFILQDHTDPASEQGLEMWLLASSGGGRGQGKNPSNLGHIISLKGGGRKKKEKKGFTY